VLLITQPPGSRDPPHDLAFRSTNRRASTTPRDQRGAGEI